MTILNVEADEILYRSCFAVEKRAYKITTSNGSVRDLRAKYTKTEIKKMLLTKDKVLNRDYTLEAYPIAEPVSHCIQVIKNTLRRLEKHGELCLWLTASDKSNFRFNVVNVEGPRGMGYKAGRPPRPVHYAEARKYLIEKCGAKEIHGYEADDALCMYQNNNTIAVHVDKDINMVVGKHINWVTMEEYEVPEGLGTVEINEKNKVIGRGLKFFYHQLLTGDATDNILGIKGIGDKTAYKILESCANENECLLAVSGMYHKKYGETYLDVLEEMADLLWMVGADKLTGSQYINEVIKQSNEEFVNG
jgi:hypothetical protein